MNRIILLIATSLVLQVSLQAQSKRYVLFEHFTQASCGPCAIQNPSFEATVGENEGKYHHVAYHTSWPGFDPMNTINPTEVQSRVNYYGVTGVPTMQMLGSVWSGGPVGVTTAQIDCAAASGAPIRLDVSFQDNGDDTQTATVIVNETGTLEGTNLKLRIAVLERVIDYDVPPGNNGESSFPNVFRLMPSSTAGISYAPSGVGTAQTIETDYDVNEDWNMNEIYIVAWLQDESTKEVINSGSSDDASWEAYTTSSIIAAGSESIDFDANLFAPVLDDEYQITYSSDAPSDWSAQIVVDGIVYTESTVAITATANNTQVGLVVSPGASASVANYTLEISSLTNTEDPQSDITYTVAAGITDLIVDHGGEATQWNEDYESGLGLAGNSSFAVTPVCKCILGLEANALDGVLNIYDNVSWTFPGFTEAETNVLSTFLDGGGNLFVNGQDLGWDTFENEGTAVTQAFYTDYLRADFQADGSAANNQLTWTEDVFFDGIENSSIINVYGGTNIYPDEFDPIEPAVALYTYNNNPNKVGALRVEENGHKVVYCGIDLGMISDSDVRHQFIQVSHDWFYGLISSVEYDFIIKDVLGQNYPNPALDVTIVPIDVLKTEAYITVIDLNGKIVSADLIQQGAVQYEMNVSDLDSGLYQYYLTTENGRSEAKSFEVIR